jgi:hypothetical protein
VLEDIPSSGNADSVITSLPPTLPDLSLFLEASLGDFLDGVVAALAWRFLYVQHEKRSTFPEKLIHMVMVILFGVMQKQKN